LQARSGNLALLQDAGRIAPPGVEVEGVLHRLSP
jgi:hypothetical protein